MSLVDKRIAELVHLLDMKAHPEGGFYAETYRSPQSILKSGEERSLTTSIYFLLRSEDVSHFHRIQSDELWYWHEGSPLTVHLLTEQGHEKLKLGPVNSDGCRPQHLVPAQTIFGSTVDDSDSYALVSCVVAPGFDFRDFELFTAEELSPLFPDAQEIIKKLT
ncbi:cupin domain-containing protein [Algoriphagus taiwanensis]|uniref:Cupin domain-containing protein n=1 Tax=Algoriphagus taiwanensis TaxID=1445656 RepID=A0ABQ6Q1R0_9BACT|nr:cupin domain-containing protein [Algoriphagus taiwanensis]